MGLEIQYGGQSVMSVSCHRSKICQKDSPHQNVFKLTLSRKSFYVFALTPKIQDYTEMSTDEGLQLCLSL